MLATNWIPAFIPTPIYQILGLILSTYVLSKIFPLLLHPFTSSLRYLPGPPSRSLLHGHLYELPSAENGELHEAWIEKYGRTLRYKGWLNWDRLYTVDHRAINHIITHSQDYRKLDLSRFVVTQFVGNGILAVEGLPIITYDTNLDLIQMNLGEQHRQQRRIMNPAFGPAQIRELTGIFVEKATRLRDIWSDEISKTGSSARIDVHMGMTRMTLDVIGLAGFNYDFDALNADGKPNELNQIFKVIFRKANGRPNISTMLGYLVPIVRLLPNRRASTIANAKARMERIAMVMIAEKKAEILRARAAGKGDSLRSRDLLTLLIKANMAIDLPESQRLSDNDMIAQIPTFIVAGHETTSNATTWCLFALCKAPEVQRKLREELFTVLTDSPTMDELQALPYLDAVIRETLRVHAPVQSITRIAAKDDVIPLSKSFTDVKGQVHDDIKIDKGTVIDVPILVLNRSKEIWGEDAREFRPERWESIPESAHNIPGVWANLMTFIGGPRACIGYRFSIVEMKALIFTLVRAFEFELAVPIEDINAQHSVMQRPILRSEKEKGAQMPMLLKPYKRS